jgi:hypothetical protein
LPGPQPAGLLAEGVPGSTLTSMAMLGARTIDDKMPNTKA